MVSYIRCKARCVCMCFFCFFAYILYCSMYKGGGNTNTAAVNTKRLILCDHSAVTPTVCRYGMICTDGVRARCVCIFLFACMSHGSIYKGGGERSSSDEDTKSYTASPQGCLAGMYGGVRARGVRVRARVCV